MTALLEHLDHALRKNHVKISQEPQPHPQKPATNCILILYPQKENNPKLVPSPVQELMVALCTEYLEMSIKNSYIDDIK